MKPAQARARAGSAPPDRTRRPPAGPPRELTLPAFQRFRLSNGLEVHVAENHTVPEVSLRLIVEAGASSEPEGQGGVADLTGRLLTEGAGDRDAHGVAVWLDRLGAGFQASVSYDVTTLAMHFLSEVTDPSLDFLAAVACDPRFDAEEVERVRAERLDEIARERDEPAVVADHRLIEAVYGSHRYGRPIGGTRETVSGLGPEEVRAFHSRRYTSAGAFLVACGDVRAEAFAEALERRLGGWAVGEGRPSPGEPPGPRDAARVLLVDRPGSPQAEIRVGTVGAPYGHPDQFPMTIANAILGGLFNSRLNMNLREEKGWTYGARSYFRFRRGPGPFVARTAVETSATAGTFREIVAELHGLVERPPTPEEMALARNALTLSLPLRFETNGQIARRKVKQLVYDLPEDYWSRYRERVGAVTRDQVVAVAERTFGEEALARVAVTDAAAVREELEAVSPVDLTPGA